MTGPKIALRKVGDLTRDPRNARTHSAEQIEQIAASIRKFGWTSPALIVGSIIYAGNGRHEAAELIYSLGERIHIAPGAERGGAVLPEGTMPVIDCTGWSEDERRAYALSDNQLALNAGWDEDRLRQELAALTANSFEIAIIGFDSKALDALFKGGEQEADPEEVPDVEPVAVSRPGDLWILGNHRIVCGSSTDAETVAALLGDDQPHLMVTDPPYGVNYDASWREEARINRKGAATGKVLNDDNADWREAWALFKGDVAYIWHAGAHTHTVADSLIATGFEMRSQIIWAKQQMVMSRGDYHWQHEPCWYAVRKGRPGHYDGGRKQTTIWSIDKPHRSETGHSTQKPVECMQRPMENNSKRGDFVYEPFSGSGTSIIAGEISDRRVLAVELSPQYVDLAVRRWEQFTHREATLQATGQTFGAVKSERLPE
jgi:DNA modification methylase